MRNDGKNAGLTSENLGIGSGTKDCLVDFEFREPLIFQFPHLHDQHAHTGPVYLTEMTMKLNQTAEEFYVAFI